MIHLLERAQFIPAAPEAIWDYFATPQNLNALTPPDMDFAIVRGGAGRMAAGQLIEYRLRIACGLRVRWLTEIRHVRAGEYFVDEQRRGPYRFWYHEHIFEPVASGVRMIDRVTYALPGWIAGELLHALFIRRRLEQIFAYRRERVIALFGEQA